MNLTLIVLLSVAVGFALGAIAIYFFKAYRRSQELKAHFGPEYDRMVRETGNRFRAEATLEELHARVQRLQLRHLSGEERVSFEKGWNRLQAQFVDEPSAALTKADGLISEVMRAIGYPIRDFEQRAGDISVDHPRVVEHYREAHSIAIRNMEHAATTEDLRHAMLRYRTLFEELLGEPAQALAERNRT